jgi:soluble lytic murein transglycosylase-like protein
LAQFMPLTWKQIAAELKLPASTGPHEAKYAIDAGAYYQGNLRRLRYWKLAPTPQERNKFGQASYNAGAGNILKALKRCPAENLLFWSEVSPCLVYVTGRHHKETLGYVTRIETYTRNIEARGFR